MRVLVLHGGGSNGRVMQGASSMFQRLLGAGAEFDFPEGTANYNNEGACANYGEFAMEAGGAPAQPSETMVALSKGDPFRGWYVMSCHAEPSDERHWREKLCDPSVAYSYDAQAEEQAERLLAHAAAEGPFDALVGFSQASVPALIAAGLSRDRGQEVPWRLSVLFCPFPVRDPRFDGLFRTPLDHPAVLCYGLHDWAYSYARHGRPVHGYFSKPVVLEHDEGHTLPQRRPLAQQLYATIATHMWWHCGATFWKVVGGAAGGGVLVRAEAGLQSKEEGARLAHGSLVRELEVSGDRLRYQLVQGGGPSSGWVSLTLKQKPLLVKRVWSTADKLPKTLSN